MKKIKILHGKHKEATLYEDLKEIKMHYPEVSLNEQARITTEFDSCIAGFVQVEVFDPKEPEFMALCIGDFEEVVLEEIVEVKRITSDRPFDEYPIGTKAYAGGGGYWIKNERGWKWCTGSTFPTPGGDWNGTVSLPRSLSQM